MAAHFVKHVIPKIWLSNWYQCNLVVDVCQMKSYYLNKSDIQNFATFYSIGSGPHHILEIVLCDDDDVGVCSYKFV